MLRVEAHYKGFASEEELPRIQRRFGEAIELARKLPERSRRPRAWPRTAKRRRCSSVNCSRLPCRCSRRTRFSSFRYSMVRAGAG
jgi:hypothetical protein